MSNIYGILEKNKIMDLENTVLLFSPGSQKVSHLELLSSKPCKGGELVIHNSAQCDLDS